MKAGMLFEVANFFGARTASKGLDYFQEKRVEGWSYQNGVIYGTVEGTSVYRSKVKLSKTGEIISSSCSCPLGGDCKHCVALFLTYKEAAANQKSKNGQGPNTAIAALSIVDQAPVAAHDIQTDHELLSTEDKRTGVQAKSAHSEKQTPLARVQLSETAALNTAQSQRAKKAHLLSIPTPSAELNYAIVQLTNITRSKSKREQAHQSSGNLTKGAKARIGYVLHDMDNLEPKISAVRINIKKDGSCGSFYSYRMEHLIEKSSQYISDEDVQISKLYNTLKGDAYFSYYSDRTRLHEEPELLKFFLQRVLATKRAYLPGNFERPLTLGEELPGALHWLENEKGEQALFVLAQRDSDFLPCFRWSIPWYVDPNTLKCGPVSVEIEKDLLQTALRIKPISKKDAECLQFILPSSGLDSFIPFPRSELPIERRVLRPAPELGISPAANAATKGPNNKVPYIVFSNTYEKDISNVPFLEDGNLVTVQANRKQEAENLQLVKNMGFTVETADESSNTTYLSSTNPAAWLNLLERADELQEAGWKISGDLIKRMTPLEADQEALELQVSEENNWWFSLALDVEIAGKKRPLLPILLSAIRSLPDSDAYDSSAIESLNTNGKFIAMMESGQILSLPFERIRPILNSLHEMFLKDPSVSADGNKMKLSIQDAAELLDSNNEYVSQWRGAHNVIDLANRLRKLTHDVEAVISDNLKTELRSYQKTGLSWLQKLAEQKFGGILADDMGLGKTIQLLAFITAAADAGILKKRPFLVVCPKSVLPNWLSECARFAPSLKVLAIAGQDRHPKLLKAKFSDVVVTSYPILVRDIDKLKDVNWSGVALDESQAIKNPETQIAKAACALKADFRFCLTGTPIENNLGELWSQFRFLLPGFLGDRSEFRRLFQTPVEKENDRSRQSLLSARIKPFILRRTKDEVATDLPEKSVLIKHVEIEGAQLDLYETVRLSMTKSVRDEIAKKGFKSSQIIILDALLKLRQVCCDPRLVKQLSKSKKVAESAKLEMLMEMLEELQQEKRKVLLFSQFTSMLDLIAEELNKRGIHYMELRGDTRDRETPVKEFQNTDVPVFLLSLKAGGTGLNLTAADVVIHYDPWWNPAAEDQATDRAHRIGQTKKVFVYKLVVKGSIEERMLQLQERKKALAASIYEGGAGSGRLLEEGDIDLLLRPIDVLES